MYTCILETRISDFQVVSLKLQIAQMLKALPKRNLSRDCKRVRWK